MIWHSADELPEEKTPILIATIEWIQKGDEPKLYYYSFCVGQYRNAENNFTDIDRTLFPESGYYTQYPDTSREYDYIVDILPSAAYWAYIPEKGLTMIRHQHESA